MVWAYATQKPSLVDDQIIDLAEARIVLTSSALDHMPRPRLGFNIVQVDESPGVQIAFSAEPASIQTLPPALRLLVLTPTDLDNPRSEQESRSRLAAAAGLLATLEGRSLLLARLFETTVSLDARGVTQHVSTPSFFVPPIREPDVSETRWQLLAALASALDGLPPGDARRIRLSLEWFESVFDLSDRDPIEVALRAWIALEALAMPDGTNIAPINKHLAAAYGISTSEAAQRFLVGKLYRLRGLIVHDGGRPLIDASVLLHTQAVYIDVLFQVMGLPCEKRASASILDGKVEAALNSALAV